MDRLAKRAHDDTLIDVFQLAGTAGYPTPWIHFDSTARGSPSTELPAQEQRPVTSLSGHLRNISQRHQTAHIFAKLANPRSHTSVMQKTKAIIDGGIDTKATRSMWKSTLLTAWALRIALLIWFNRLKPSRRSNITGPNSLKVLHAHFVVMAPMTRTML